METEKEAERIAGTKREIENHYTLLEFGIHPDTELAKRKRYEEHIGHLAAIVESSDDAIISKSLNGIIRSWNNASEKIFGHTAKEAIGKHISLIIPPECVGEESTILERIRNNHVIEHYETKRLKKNGEQFYVSITVSPLKDLLGNVIGACKIARDITLRRKAEENLVLVNNKLIFQNEEKEKRASELAIANRELAFQNDEKEKRASELIIANRELAFQSNEKEKRAAELITANIELVFQNKEKEKRASELVIANKELAFQRDEKESRAAELITANLELVFQNNEKEKRAAELNVANRELAFQNEEKGRRAAELVAVNEKLVFENEEKAKSEAALLIANKELEQLTYIASHDLQEPLRTIANYMQIFEEDYSEQLDDEAFKYIGSVKVAANRMSVLVRALLDFSRLGRNKELVYVDCKKLIDDIIGDLRGVIANSNAIIHVTDMPKLNMYELEIGQLFQNLITNAIKFQKKGVPPLIRIRSVKINEAAWQFSVSDNGIGVEPVYFQRVFDIFQRLHVNDDYQGYGIGLANCKKIVELHQGEIWMESTPGHGTTINFTIPCLTL
jgi:PAS domain S-box-containing protein